jgi:PAS domain-containing protein
MASKLPEVNISAQDLQSLVENEIYLRQMAENIDQVFWVRDLRTERILYVSPAYETVWGRSCESLYANPQSFIESVHPEDRLQVMVAGRTTIPSSLHRNTAFCGQMEACVGF